MLGKILLGGKVDPNSVNNIEGDAKLSSIQVRLATTCEAIIGEFEDAELEVKRVKRGGLVA